jgi:endonuclease YncB( thermonuclease family)
MSPAHASTAITGHPEVVDGDELVFGSIRVRLHGIDAAELGQRCAEPRGGTWGCDEAAADRLEALIGGGSVTCEPLDQEVCGRVIALCSAGDRDVADVLVAEGLAWEFPRYLEDYAETEDRARSGGAGIWQASTEPPWEFRADRWERAAKAAPGNCPIKGNISQGRDDLSHAVVTLVLPHEDQRVRR